MTGHDGWQLIGTGSGMVVSVWWVAVVFTHAPFRLGFARTLATELRPFALAGIVGQHLAVAAVTHNPLNVHNLLGTGLLLVTWLLDRNDDDRWKRRRRKVRERITRTASGRLAVEPA